MSDTRNKPSVMDQSKLESLVAKLDMSMIPNCFMKVALSYVILLFQVIEQAINQVQPMREVWEC